jgi:putative ATP-dependent endonuclease of the OLD family
MHISRLQLVNYRNFSQATVKFEKGVNTIIGENGSGKTNLFRAIRLLLDDNLLRMAHRLDDRDFHRGLGEWRGHWIIISLEFTDVSQDETIQSLFLHGAGNIAGTTVDRATYNLIFRPKASIRQKLAKLAEGDRAALAMLRQDISLADYETVFTGKSSADFADPTVYRSLVGNFEAVTFPSELTPPEIGGIVPGMFSISHEIGFTFIQALRDVVAEFQNNRTNPLLTLLKGKSGKINEATFAPISGLVRDLNSAIEGLNDVRAIRTDIRDTITDAAGETYSPKSLSIRSDLSDEPDRLFQSLKLFVGEAEAGYEGGIHELSLGGANLIYLTLKLLEFKYQKVKQTFANFLVIEEPEAHIHTHIQKTLFDRLNYEDTQIIYSTHSTHVSEVSNVENINILGRSGGVCEVYQPSAGLDAKEIGNIQRYLDAVRSNLLFAKSVLLVEGDAEEILIPILIKQVFGLSLDELGVSLINIRSTGFDNVAILFHDKRIRKNCAIITDLDEAFINLKPELLDDVDEQKAKKRALASQTAGQVRAGALTSFCSGNSWLSAHFARHTFEVDFILAGNSAAAVSILGDVYSDAATIALAKADLESGNIARYGTRVLRMARHVGKGWFAIVLGKAITPDSHIPDYIMDALFMAHRPISTETLTTIIDYRLKIQLKANGALPVQVDAMRVHLERFRSGVIDFAAVRTEMLKAFPGDRINTFFATL